MTTDLYNDGGCRRLVVSVTIPSGAAISDAADLRGMEVDAVRMPAAWTAAALAVSESPNAGVSYSWNKVYDDGGAAGAAIAEWRLAATASQTVLVGAALDPFRYVRLRSVDATTGAAVNQAADRVVSLMCRPS